MPFFDFPLDKLQDYKPDRIEPTDFDTFWQNTISESIKHRSEPSFISYDSYLSSVDVYNVSFSGYMGQTIKGWLLLPKSRDKPLPCIVEYIGYGGGRGFPVDWLTYSAAGYAHFVMDTRGQGSSWRHGDTPDIVPDGDNPQQPGFMTRGVLSPATYYYRRVFTDAVLAVDAVRRHAAVDSTRIVVTGGSQGGGIALAVGGLVPDLTGVMPDVPFLCHYRRATHIVDTLPYAEISRFLMQHRHKVEQVFDTLAYFDGVNFAARATAPAYFSVGLMDDICPPSTVYAAYNHYAGDKQIAVYEYNNHEGGGSHHTMAKLSYLRSLLGDD